jgi:hypothetical protein
MRRILALSGAKFLAFIMVMGLMPATGSALTTDLGGTWGTPGNDGPDSAPLKPTASWTCMLTGVSGSFVGNPALGSKPALPASAAVVMKGGFWVMRTRSGVGPGVMAHIMCIPITTGRVEFSWADNLATQGVPATPTRHCFLREVWATSGLTGPKSKLKITRAGSQFDMNGSFVNNFGGDRDFGGATAVCVDIVPTATFGFTWIGPNSGSSTITLRNFFPSGPPVPVAGVGCFLTGIAGRWVNPDPDPLGWNDGAFLTGPVGLPPASVNWRLQASNGREGDVSCLR